MSYTKINCPACDQPIEIPNAMRGGPVKCPTCDIGFIAPGKPVKVRPPMPLGTWIYGGLVVLTLGIMFCGALVSEEARTAILYLVLIICGLMFYFAPAILAHQRRHPNVEAIAVLNLVGGWTVLGWVVAIVWAHTKKA